MSIEVSGDLQCLLARIRFRKADLTNEYGLTLICDEKGYSLNKTKLRYWFDKARKLAADSAATEEFAEHIRSVQFRDLRAKAGTDKREGGPDAAKDLLDHTSTRMTERYIRRRKGQTVRPVKK